MWCNELLNRQRLEGSDHRCHLRINKQDADRCRHRGGSDGQRQGRQFAVVAQAVGGSGYRSSTGDDEGAEASAACGAPYGKPSTDRVNQRNGYRERRWDTRVGTIDLAIPKLRKGSYFAEWLLEPRRRAERALMQVVTECYVRGVSTRRVDGLVPYPEP